jgi:O-methyltransferase involved in polyketide biosynthesis
MARRRCEHRAVTEARDAKIGPTAHYTAYAWHRLRLPYAEHFVTARGRRLYWLFRGSVEWIALATSRSPLLVDVLSYRHRTIDAQLSAIRPDVVVEIGAGLSRRGTWAVLDAGVERYLEIDLPHMVAAKTERLAPLHDRLGDRLRVEAHDILDPRFGEWLASALRGARSAVVIAEGVLGYFDLAERERIVRAVIEGLRSAQRGVFLCDLRDRDRMASVGYAVPVLRAAVRLVTRGRGLREDFETSDAIGAFFARSGAYASPVETPSERAMPTRIWRAAPR